MGEISSLLKAMKVEPTLKALVSRTSTTEEGVLLDSGATHNLRKPYSEQEWNEAVEIEVQTAVGIARLRQSQDFSTLLTKAEETQPIPALGLLTEAGSRVTWHRDGCFIKHPARGEIKVYVKGNCPYLDENMGMTLTREVEENQKKKAACLRTLTSGESDLSVFPLKFLEKIFTEAPAKELVNLGSISKEYDTEQLPWNRRRRRRIAGAKGVALHLFAGPDQGFWRKRMPKDVEFLGVDLLAGQDALCPNVMSYLVSVVKTGKVIAFLAGPPCRSASVCRHRPTKDGKGPRPVRSRHGLQRWGLVTNTVSEQGWRSTDNQLVLRTLLLGYLAKQANPDVKACVETPEDPVSQRGRR